jgi:hypothetical protein
LKSSNPGCGSLSRETCGVFTTAVRYSCNGARSVSPTGAPQVSPSLRGTVIIRSRNRARSAVK